MTSQFKNALAAAVIFGGLLPAAFGQTYSYSPAYPPAPPVAPADTTQLTYSTAQLDQMLAPIALYPDPLLSEVLAAATYPQDVAAAGQWLAIRPDRSPQELDSQPWDPSVKALCGFPDIVRMLAANMMWTEALGNAFVNQQPGVMDSVQRLRLEAQSAQTLKSTPQQTVFNDGGVVEILPAQAELIYCPVYDPALVYSTPAVVTFGPACPYGPRFDLGLDFHQNRFLRDVHLDRDHHRFDFTHAQPWQHDPHRPIPRPHEALYPPPAPQAHRGWTETTRVPGAFIAADGRRAHEPAPPRANDRLITDLPPAPERNVPITPAPHIGQRTAAQPSAPVPARPNVPSTPATPRNERSVTGLPQHSPPTEHGASERPAATPAPAEHPGQSAFHPGVSAATSARGESSMHR